MRFREEEKPDRNYPLDIARLIAIFLMLFAHVVSFFYNGTSSNFLFIRDWINIVSFTTFLFISGAVTYLVHLHKLHSQEINKAKLIKRVGILLLGYYFLAIVASFEKITNFIDTQGALAGLKLIGKIFLLIEVPGYTEFIIPFIFFTLILLLFPGMIRKIVKNPILLLSVGFALFIIGEILVNSLTLPANWAAIGALFYGSPNNEFYRFPFLQYGLVYLFGMYWGLIISDKREDNTELARQAFFMVIMSITIVVSYFIGGSDILFQRWPPSLSFLIIGITWTGFILIFVQKLKIFSGSLTNLYLNIPILQKISASSFNIWLAHTFLLFLLTVIGFPSTSNIFVIVIEYVLSVIISVFAILYFGKMVKSLPAGTTRNISILIFIMAVSLILGVSILNLRNDGGPDEADPNSVATIILPSIEKPKPDYWYSAQYPYKLDISFNKVDNNNKFPTVVKKGDWVEMELDHASYVGQKMSRADGADLILLYWDGTNYSPLKFSLKDINTTKTKLTFELYEEADLNYRNAGYTLFFGDLVDAEINYEVNYPLQPYSRIAYQLSDVNIIPFKIEATRFWHIKDDTLSVKFQLPEIITEADAITYEMYPTPYTNESEAIIRELVNWNPERVFELQIPLDELAYGNYYTQIRVNIAEPDVPTFQSSAVKYLVGKPETQISEIQSNVIGFRYTAPLFVTWTIDWEGYGLKEEYWKDMVNLSDTYGMPMTHLFNPRIYTNPEVTPTHANQMTNWVKDRLKNGDEIGLHLHMHYDLVSAAGLTPKTSPAWGGREAGHDVLTSAYNYDEFLQILNWSKQKFKEKGLPVPKGFRAGAWFVDLDNLRALSTAGFVYDTSGSDYKEPYGPNKQSREWNLTPTTKPYRPSFSNQNAPSPQPLMTIWEYPNNGADSTNRTADELIRRFNLNMTTTSGFLTDPQVLTYMSHAHWFGTIDRPVMSAALEEASKYKYSNDAGPVVFLTSLEAHNRYQKAIAK